MFANPLFLLKRVSCFLLALCLFVFPASSYEFYQDEQTLLVAPPLFLEGPVEGSVNEGRRQSRGIVTHREILEAGVRPTEEELEPLLGAERSDAPGEQKGE